MGGIVKIHIEIDTPQLGKVVDAAIDFGEIMLERNHLGGVIDFLKQEAKNAAARPTEQTH